MTDVAGYPAGRDGLRMEMRMVATCICQPHISSTTFHMEVERIMVASAGVLFRAWTMQFDRWFAAPGTVLMRGEVDQPFFSKLILRECAIRTTAVF